MRTRYLQVFQCKDDNEGQYILVDAENHYLRYFDIKDLKVLNRFLLSLINKDIFDTKDKEFKYYPSQTNTEQFDSELNSIFDDYGDDTIIGIESMNDKHLVYVFNKKKWNKQSKEAFKEIYKNKKAVQMETNI